MKAVSVKALVTKLLSIEEADLTTASGWTWYSSGGAGKVYKWGRIGMLSLEVKPTASVVVNGTERKVATIPQGFRPLTSVGIVSLHQGSGTTFFLSRVASNGEVFVARLRDVGNANGNYTTATTTHWFPIHVIYIVGGVIRKLLSSTISERRWTV